MTPDDPTPLPSSHDDPPHAPWTPASAQADARNGCRALVAFIVVCALGAAFWTGVFVVINFFTR